MVNCDLCPIKEECAEERERIMNETSNQWATQVYGSIEDCPLVVLMHESLARSRVLTVETKCAWDT